MIESSWGVGMSFGPTLGGALAELGGFKLPFWAVGGALTAIGIGMLFFKSDVSVEMLDDKRYSLCHIKGCFGVTIVFYF